MKKHFMKGAAALTLTLAAVSCSNNADYTMSLEEQKTAQYEAAFVQAFGKIDQNQDWGFGSTRSGLTRAAAEFGWELSSDYDATFDRQYYDDVFTYLPEGVNAGTQLTNYEFVSKGPFQFSIIYSQTSGKDKVGYYYYNPKTQTVNDKTEVIFVENLQEDLGNYVQVRWGNNSYWENMSSSAGSNMWNGSWGSTVTEAKAKVFTVNVPAGYRVGFFLQQGDFKGYSNSSLNNANNTYYSAVVQKDGDTYLVGLEDWNNQYFDSDLDCNDVIMAINGGNIPTPVDPDAEDEEEEGNTGEPTGSLVDSGRIFCEDMGSIGDFDFNDVVFDAYLYTDRVEITILAAGGTLPMSVAGRNVHDTTPNGLGAGMVNTGAGATADPVSFTVYFDETTKYETLNDIPVVVNIEAQDITLKSVPGEAPQKICAPVNTKWAVEYENINKAYSKFSEWVKGTVATPWDEYDTNYLYGE